MAPSVEIRIFEGSISVIGRCNRCSLAAFRKQGNRNENRKIGGVGDVGIVVYRECLVVRTDRDRDMGPADRYLEADPGTGSDGRTDVPG